MRSSGLQFNTEPRPGPRGIGNPLVTIILTLTILLAINLKWAGIDPYNPASGPSWLWASFGAILTMAFFLLAIALKLNGHKLSSAFIGAYALGSALGPSVNPPHNLSMEEEPSSTWRFLERKRIALGGGVIKTVVVVVFAPIAGLVAPDGISGAYLAAGALALCWGCVKAAVFDDDVAEAGGSGRFSPKRKPANQRKCTDNLSHRHRRSHRVAFACYTPYRFSAENDFHRLCVDCRLHARPDFARAVTRKG